MDSNSEVVILSREDYDSILRRVTFLEEALQEAILTVHVEDRTAHMVIGNSASHPKGESCYICRAQEV